MANSIVLITKYLKDVVDKVFAKESTTAILEKGGKFVDLNFKEAGYVKVASFLLDGLSDYYRANNVDFESGSDYSQYTDGTTGRQGFARGSVSVHWELFRLAYDRGKQFLIDEEDNEETAGLLIANVLTEFLRTKVVPEVDELRYSRICEKASTALGNLVSETPTSTDDGSNILTAWNNAFVWLEEHEVPSEEQVIFVSPTVWGLVLNNDKLSRYITQGDYRSAEGLTFNVKKYMDRPIIVVPSSRFFTDVVIGANGYYASSTSKIINYIICSKKAVLPIVKLQYTKIWGPAEVQDFQGYKVNIRLYHDCFIPKNKIPGVYVSVGATLASSKTGILSVEVDATEHKITRVFTTPAGLNGELYYSSSDFASVGTTDATGTKVEVGEVIATGTYYVALKRNGVVIAKTTTSITL